MTQEQPDGRDAESTLGEEGTISRSSTLLPPPAQFQFPALTNLEALPNLFFGFLWQLNYTGMIA